MRIFFEILIAVNIKEFAALPGADETIACLGLQAEFYLVAQFVFFNGELLLYLRENLQASEFTYENQCYNLPHVTVLR
jgi:hypothetical protein